MKKFFGIVLMLFLIAGFSALSYAGEGGMTDMKGSGEVMTQKADIRAYRLTIGKKAARGVKNILLGWTELPKRIIDVTKKTENPIWGLVVGSYEGSLKAVGRTLSGAVDVLTAPVNPQGAPLIPADIEKL